MLISKEEHIKMKTNTPTRLFIVEDNFLCSYILDNILKEYGNFQITTFATAEESIKLLDNDPDVIILDYNLDNGMNGLEAFKIIQGRKPQIPVIVFSSQTDVKITADLVKIGVFDYIEKKDMHLGLEKLKKAIIKAIISKSNENKEN